MHDTLTVYSIYDTKSEGWSRPIFSRNDATAQRELRDVIAHGQTPYSMHPADYTLFKLGSWSEFKPFIEFLAAPEAIVHLVQLAPKRTEYSDLNSAA